MGLSCQLLCDMIQLDSTRAHLLQFIVSLKSNQKCVRFYARSGKGLKLSLYLAESPWFIGGCLIPCQKDVENAKL